MEKISCTDNVGKEVLHGVEERNILHTVKRGKAGGIGHIVHWNCLLQRDIEGKIEGKK
jgi:hypothetical protein